MKILSYRISQFLALAHGKNRAAPAETRNTRLPSDERSQARLSLGEKGQTLVEFGFLAPVMIATLTGILSLGMCLGNYVLLNQAQNAAGQALFLSSSGGATELADPCLYIASALTQAGPNLTTGLKLTVSFPNYSKGPAAPDSSFSCPNQALPTPHVGILGTVTATYPCNISVLGVAFDPSCTLKASQTEVIQ